MKISYGKGLYLRLEGGRETRYTGEVTLDEVKIYIDGELKATQPLDGSVSIRNSTGISLGIGQMPTGGLYFDGLIDEVRLYNRALSPDEIGQLYRLGARTAEFRKY